MRPSDFLLSKWQERALELGRSEPRDLSGACKFAALFAQQLIGGKIRAHPKHTWLMHNKQVVDLTGGIDSQLYVDDPRFRGNVEFQASLESCRPRISQWVTEYREAMVLFHGTSSSHLSSIGQTGLANPYLTTSPEIASYFATEAQEEAGGEEVVLEVWLTPEDFEFFCPDRPMLDEPLSMVWKDQVDCEDDWYPWIKHHWPSNWVSALECTQSLKINRRIPIEQITY